MILLAFEVPAVQPRPKGSLNGRCLRDRSHTVVYREQVADSKDYRKAVAAYAKQEMRRCELPAEPFDQAVKVRVVFYLAKSHVMKAGKRTDSFWPSHDTPFPTAHDIGDLDKMCRNVGDALQDAKLIADDSLITGWINPDKLWAPDNVPTTFIEVWTVTS